MSDKQPSKENIRVIPQLKENEIVEVVDIHRPDGSINYTIVVQNFQSGEVIRNLETDLHPHDVSRKWDDWVDRLNSGDVIIQD